MVVPDLFSREQTTPPTVTLAVWVGLVALAASIVLVCYRYRDRVATHWVLRGLLHLWNTRNWLSYREIAVGMLGLNLLLAVINTVLGSNYGYTHLTPVLGSDQVWLNVAAVSLLLIGLMIGTQWLVQRKL